MSPSQLSWLVLLHYRHGFHSRLANLDRLLRYFLGFVFSILCFKMSVAKQKPYNELSLSV